MRFAVQCDFDSHYTGATFIVTKPR